MDTEPCLYIRNPATVVWLFIGRKKNGSCRYIDSRRPPRLELSSSPLYISSSSLPTGAFSRFVDRVLSLNFNITRNAIWYAGREIYFTHDTPPRAALRGRVTLDLRAIEFVRMFFPRSECDLRNKSLLSSLYSISPFTEQTNTEIE